LPITTSGTTPNNFLYSGEQYDGVLGMYYLRARYYNPATGRFLAMDPYEGDILNPATLHRYAYARDNPVNVTDPTGRDALIEWAEVFEINEREGWLRAANAIDMCDKESIEAISEVQRGSAPGSGDVANNILKCILEFGWDVTGWPP
jgi:RHS repeat-associated protein